MQKVFVIKQRIVDIIASSWTVFVAVYASNTAARRVVVVVVIGMTLLISFFPASALPLLCPTLCQFYRIVFVLLLFLLLVFSHLQRQRYNGRYWHVRCKREIEKVTSMKIAQSNDTNADQLHHPWTPPFAVRNDLPNDQTYDRPLTYVPRYMYLCMLQFCSLLLYCLCQPLLGAAFSQKSVGPCGLALWAGGQCCNRVHKRAYVWFLVVVVIFVIDMSL